MRSITEVLTETEELQDVSGQAGSRASIRDDTETDQSVDDEELEAEDIEVVTDEPPTATFT